MHGIPLVLYNRFVYTVGQAIVTALILKCKEVPEWGGSYTKLGPILTVAGVPRCLGGYPYGARQRHTP